MAEPNKKLRQRIRDFLKTKRGSEFTTLAGVAAHFDMSLTQMLLEVGSDAEIYASVEKNKAAVKEKMRQIWRKSDKPNLHISAYRLEADSDELTRLSGESPKSNTLERKDPLLEILQADKIWGDSNG